MAGKLTPKEIECLYLAGRRLSDAEIAQRLELSPRTVGNHLARAYAKLGVRDRIRAAAKLSELYSEYPLPIIPHAHEYWRFHQGLTDPPTDLEDAEAFILTEPPATEQDAACILDVVCSNAGDVRCDGLEHAALRRIQRFLLTAGD
jgi:DNA-binding CsgD family transcriptional regulator